MTSFARAHDRYLEPPDDDPICEDFCGEVLQRDNFGNWTCVNKFCPSRFQGVEKEMAEALVEALEDVRTWKVRYEAEKRTVELYRKFAG